MPVGTVMWCVILGFAAILYLLYLQCFNQLELYWVKFMKWRTYVFAVQHVSERSLVFADALMSV